jgi:hypothetical protein
MTPEREAMNGLVPKCYSKTCDKQATVKAEFQSGRMALYCADDAAKFRTTHNTPMPPPERVEQLIHLWPLLAAPTWIQVEQAPGPPGPEREVPDAFPL